ncbi:metallophosphoesterase [Nocardioides yefusunii]|uniref:Metallophosphoesterase n=1 Tax=Nocardioides yefusunii TaxID=2500546 RepID=A0ABW1QTF4_9ACTN|nr:metallophosphoesterase [Nocardioides yefusunii]
MDEASVPAVDPAAAASGSGTTQGRGPRPVLRRRLLAALVLGVVWLVITTAVAFAFFLSSERTTELVGHDAVVAPRLDSHAVLATGPVLPDVRIEIDSPVGVEITLGKTDAETTEELISRYSLIVSNPEAQADKVVDLVVAMGVSALVRGAAAGLVPVILYLLVGPGRRRAMWDDLRHFRFRPVLAVALVLAVGVAMWQPWWREEAPIASQRDWTTLDDFLGDDFDLDLPADAAAVQIRANAATDGSKKLVGSVVDTWSKSQTFYDDAAAAAAEQDLRQPGTGETVTVFVTDRHDNVGMDRVAKALADAVGSTTVFDGGDDTSTGKPWEAFSLESLDKEFKTFDRWAVTGNHDHGTFVGDKLARLGWNVLEGDVVEGPNGGRLMGYPDPRSSGLGSWRDDKGISFADAQQKVADEVCALDEAGERVNTLLVHDPNLAKKAIAAGCADLVIGGHHHVDKGPTLVEGENSKRGYTFTNGTTGGAAYAIAVGSKPKRDAQISLITYGADGRPVGLQLVTLRTDGKYEVDPFVAFDFADPKDA